MGIDNRMCRWLWLVEQWWGFWFVKVVGVSDGCFGLIVLVVLLNGIYYFILLFILF